MNRIALPLSAAAAVAIALIGLGVATAQQNPAPAPAEGPGWTGLTNPDEIIAARQALMFAIEGLMLPIDTYTVDPSDDPDVLTANAATIAAMLQATPHLFPPTTDLYDADADYPATLALPAIWQSFETFRTMAGTSVTAALTLAEASDAESLHDGAVNLRATCDACHAFGLRPYVPSTVTEEDKNFDFDSLFGP